MIEIMSRWLNVCCSGRKAPRNLSFSVLETRKYSVVIEIIFPKPSCTNPRYALTYKYAHLGEEDRKEVVWDLSKDRGIYYFAYWMDVEFNGTIICDEFNELVSGIIFTGIGREYFWLEERTRSRTRFLGSHCEVLYPIPVFLGIVFPL